MSADLRALWRAAGGNVPDHWTFQTIEELLESQKSISVGVMYPGSNVLGGTPLIRVSDVKNGAIAKKPDFCISSEVDQEYRRTKLFGSELLITLVGNPGDCVIVTEEMIGWNAARALAVLKLKDPDLRRWLRYVLLSKPAKHLIDARLNTTVQKTLNLKDIRELGVPIPPKEERYKITNVIDAIENKMLLNTQTNQTLESIAQAIFKSWFVDFEPVKAKMAALAEGGTRAQAELAAMGAISGKGEAELAQLQQQNPEHYQQLAETAALFPSAMVESELGEIPEGWEVLKIESVLQRLTIKNRYTKTEVYPYGKTPVFEQGTGILLGYHNGQPEIQASPENPAFIFGDHTCVMHLSCSPFDISANVIPLKGKKYPTIWTYYAVLGKQEFQEYRRHWSELAVKDVIAPVNDALTYVFERMIRANLLLQEELKKESSSLAELRDSLLPKLLSGELNLEQGKTWKRK